MLDAHHLLFILVVEQAITLDNVLKAWGIIDMVLANDFYFFCTSTKNGVGLSQIRELVWLVRDVNEKNVSIVGADGRGAMKKNAILALVGAPLLILYYRLVLPILIGDD